MRVIVSRPNTVGVFHERTFDTEAQAMAYVVTNCTRLALQGWKLCTVDPQTFELSHDDEADVILMCLVP
jgi:hypothetical protein